MFDKMKKKLKEDGKKGAENTRNFNAAEEKMRELGIDKKMYSSYLKVKTNAYIADKGIVFKKAINKAEDLRLPWETITDVTIDGKTLEIICDNVTYVVWFVDKNISEVFYDYVKSHMKGIVDDGWS